MAYEIGAVRASASLDSTGFTSGTARVRSDLRGLEGGFQKTSREALRAVEAMARGSDAGFGKSSSATQKQIAALTGLDRATKSTSATSKAWAAQLNRQAQAYDQLRSSLDPVYTSSKKYEQVVDQIEAAVRSGLVSQREANQVMEQAAQKYLGLVPAAEQAARAQEQAVQKAQSLRSAYESARASVDPLYASSKQYETIQRQMNEAVAAGVVTQKEASQVLDRASERYLGAGANVLAYGQKAKVGAFQTANLAAQFNDIGVMLAAGQSPLMLALQQGTQVSQIFSQMGGSGASAMSAIKASLLSVVSPLSLVTIGAIAGGAALGQWVISLFAGGKEAKTFENRISDLTSIVSEYQKFADMASSSTEDLEERFGLAGGSAREVANFLSEFKRVDALEKVAEEVQAITEAFGGLSDRLVILDDSRGFVASILDKSPVGYVTEISNTVKVLEKELKLTEQQAQAVAEGLRGLSEADGPKEALASAAELQRVFLETFGTVLQIPPELRELAKQAGLVAISAGEILTAEQKGTIEVKRRAEAAGEIVARYNEQAELANAIAAHGEDSAEVEALKRAEALRTAEELIKQENLSGIVAQRVRDAAIAAYEAEVNSAAAADALRDAEAAAKGLASAIASAAGFSANLEGGVRILEAEVRALEQGADAAIASGLEAKRIRAENMRDAQIAAGQDRVIANTRLALDLAAIERQGELIAQKNALTEANRKAGSSGDAASRNSLAGIRQEIAQRRVLLSLTGEQRAKYEAVIQVQRRLGKEAAKVSKAQINALAKELVMLDKLQAEYDQITGRAEDIAGQVTDAIFDPDNAADAAKQMFQTFASEFVKNKIVLPIVGQFLGVQGGVAGLGGGISAATSGGGPGSLGGLGNLAGLTGGGVVSGIGSGFMGVLSGGGLGSSFANLGGLLTGASGGWGALGAALPALGIIAGGLAVLAKGLSREYDGRALRGSLGADGFDGFEFDFWDGGFLRGDKQVNYPTGTEMQTQLDVAAKGVRTNIEDMADALGLGADAIKDFTGDGFTIWLSGPNAGSQADIAAQLEDQLSDLGDGMAELVLGTEKYSQAGEGAYDTLTRLGTSLLVVNDAFDLLNTTLFDTSLLAADHASDLIDTFGGVDAMTTSLLSYWNAFYSEAEREAITLRRLEEQFADLGLTMPGTRDGFRELVNGIDLTTDSGRDLYAQLIGLSGSMDQVLPAVGTFTAQMAGMVSDIEGEIGLQVEAAQAQARLAEQSASLWYKTASTLRDFLSDLLNSDLTAASANQAALLNKSRYDTAFELARGGDVEAAQDIPALAKAYLASAQANATSSLEYRRIAAQVQGQVDFLGGIADLEGANDEVTAGLYEQQIDVLTSLNNFLQLEGLTDSQVSELAANIQDLHGDWDGTVAAFESSLGALEDAIENAEAFSYDDLVGSLDVAVALSDNSPRWLQKLVDEADTGIRTTLDFVIRRDDLSAADRWIATNALSEHVSTIDLVLGSDLDRATRALALETDVELRRDLYLTLAQDLDQDTRTLLLNKTSNLSRRVDVALTSEGANTIARLDRLQDLIGGESGKLTFDGGVQLTADTVFSDLNSSTGEVATNMDVLGLQLDALRLAMETETKRQETLIKVSNKQIRGAAAVEESQKATGVVDRFNALRAQYGVSLVGQDGSVSVDDAGKIKSSFDYYGGTTANLTAFKQALEDEFGTQNAGKIFSQTNSDVASAEERIQRLRAQIIKLGQVPSFARGGDHRGGFAHVGENDIELVAPSRIYNPSETKSMLDNRQVVAELQKLTQEVAELKDHQRRADFQKIKTMKEGVTIQRRVEVEGIKTQEAT